MKSSTPIVALVLAVLVGTVAAFFRPAAVYQQGAVGAAAAPQLLFGLVDSGLDNPHIATDDNITPARKCGFCMG